MPATMGARAVLLGALASQCVLPAGSVPAFTVNLNDAPKLRWASTVEYYREEILAMARAQRALLEDYLGDQAQAWLDIPFDEEYLDEMRGMVETVNHSDYQLDDARLANMLYEMGSPTTPLSGGCSGVLWVMPNGTVLHGRNMDYYLGAAMPDGRVLNWPDVTFEVTFVRDGQPLMKATQWPGHVGLNTAMRFGGWGFEQNTRRPNDWHGNLAAAQNGGQVYGLVVRRLMETVPDFDTAVERLYAENYMAEQYFVMSGSGPHQGAVLTIDRNHEPGAPPAQGTPPIQRVGNASGATWHLVQTNDDLLEPTLDPRRPLANARLRRENQSIVDEAHLLLFMHTPLLFNPMTVFTTVMSPATGHYETVLPDEPPYWSQAPASAAQVSSGGGNSSRAAGLSKDRPAALHRPPAGATQTSAGNKRPAAPRQPAAAALPRLRGWTPARGSLEADAVALFQHGARRLEV